MNVTNSTIAGAILSGGKNTRMKDKNKAFININGMPLIQKIVNLLGRIFDEIMIITNSPEEYKAYQGKCTILADKIKDIGPLGGIYTGLSETGKDAVFFVACDMPNLHNDVILKEISFFDRTGCDAVIPRIDSLIEPLHSIFKTNLKNKLYDFVKNRRDYSIRNFLQTINVSYMCLEDNQFHRNAFQNINTIKDLEEMEKIDANQIKDMD